MSRHVLGILQVAMASICFGFLGVFGKFAFAAGISVGSLLSVRFSLAAILLAFTLSVYRPGSLRIGAKQTMLSFLLGFFGYAVFSTLYFMAIRGLSVPLAVLLLYTFPFWTIVFNAILGERPKQGSLLVLLGALIGLILLLWGEIRAESLLAFICGVGSAVTYAMYIIVSSRYQKGVSAIGSGFWIIMGAAMGLWIFHHPSPSTISTWNSSQWTPLFGLAIVCTIAPLTLVQAGLQRLSSSETALLSMIEPVTATLAAALFLNEHLARHQIVGGILVLFSLLFRP